MPSKPPKKPLPKTKHKHSVTAASARPPPNWPALSPLVPTEDLQFETLLEGQVIIVRNLFTSSLCHKYVQYLSSLPLVTTPVTPKNGDALRVNDRFEVQDVGFAQRLWSETGLESLVTGRAGAVDAEYGGGRDGDENAEAQEEVEKDAIEKLKALWGGEVCGLNPRIRVYRYGKGHFFGQHYTMGIAHVFLIERLLVIVGRYFLLSQTATLAQLAGPCFFSNYEHLTMASLNSLLISSLISYFSFLYFEILGWLYLVFLVALAIYGLCWITLDILMVFIVLIEVPAPMASLYHTICPWFDIYADETDEEYSTYNPALSSWAFSVLTFVLWALPDSVVVVDPDRYLTQIDST
ncbi:hypothetical protein MMC07_008132 [Pseudocyphellaria aurata]|nr:hypothetical protein [Pseudocyphellaria aurata]